MEYSPPPFFKQGPSARARFIFFSVLAITLLVADARFNALVSIRRVVAIGLYPAQRAVLLPVQGVQYLGAYFASVQRLTTENERLRRENTSVAQASLDAEQLKAENAELRRLLDIRQKRALKSVTVEVLYEARDPSARRVVIDKGSQDGLVPGLPVVDDAGVIGQVTRVFPYLSEITLLTDKNQVTAVQDIRSGLRAVAYGGAEGGTLDLRFLAANADVKDGDTLVTSGIDGVFPAGLPVARVEDVHRNPAYSFAEIRCVPIGGTERNRHLLVLIGDKPPPPPPPPEPVTPPKLKRRSPV